MSSFSIEKSNNYDKNLWEKCVSFHGHACPGLVSGFKVSRLVQEDMDIDFSQDEELVCVSENDACGVDAIQFITGCTLGKGNLIRRPVGKQAYSFFDRNKNNGIRYVMDRPEELPEDRQKVMDIMLNMSPKKLFESLEPHYSLPEEAQIFETVECESCGEGAAEFAVRFQAGNKVCLDCYESYSRVHRENLRENS